MRTTDIRRIHVSLNRPSTIKELNTPSTIVGRNLMYFLRKAASGPLKDFIRRDGVKIMCHNCAIIGDVTNFSDPCSLPCLTADEIRRLYHGYYYLQAYGRCGKQRLTLTAHPSNRDYLKTSRIRPSEQPILS